MPAPGTRVNVSPAFAPAHLMGITVHPDNPFMFDVLINQGQSGLSENEKNFEYNKLVKYFLTSLTIPDDDQWVNLSPYEQNRIITAGFGKTAMGRDLLAQDYLLKQLTSSLMYPESSLGKEFWDKVYAKAYEALGHTNIPVNTFNKVWIVPDKAVIYESGNTAYVIQSHLKVMLEEDYLARNKHIAIAKTSESSGTVASQLIREIILPEIEREVNEGKNFAQLRQIVSGMILATWFKRTFKESLLGKVYADKDKTKGIDQDPKQNEAIYQHYLAAFKKGVYNYIKEDQDGYTGQSIPRKYFAGGFVRGDPAQTVTADTITPELRQKAARVLSESNADRAVIALDRVDELPGVSFGRSSSRLEGGAQIISSLTPQDLRTMMTAKDEQLYVHVKEKGQRGVLSLVHNPWRFKRGALKNLYSEFDLPLKAERVYQAQEKENVNEPIVIVDWGAGEAQAMIELSKSLTIKRIPHKIYAFSFDYFRNWNNAPPEITFILDDARNVNQYVPDQSVDFIVSYNGLQHLLNGTNFRSSISQMGDGKVNAREHMEDLGRVLKKGGVIVTDGVKPLTDMGPLKRLRFDVLTENLAILTKVSGEVPRADFAMTGQRQYDLQLRKLTGDMLYADLPRDVREMFDKFDIKGDVSWERTFTWLGARSVQDLLRNMPVIGTQENLDKWIANVEHSIVVFSQYPVFVKSLMKSPSLLRAMTHIKEANFSSLEGVKQIIRQNYVDPYELDQMLRTFLIPYVLDYTSTIDLETLDVFNIRFTENDDFRYFLSILANAQTASPDVRAKARQLVGERMKKGRIFPLQSMVNRLFSTKDPVKILVIQNNKDGQGDELVRVHGVLGGLINFKSEVRKEVTVVSSRPYLYGSDVKVIDPRSVALNPQQYFRDIEKEYDIVIYNNDGENPSRTWESHVRNFLSKKSALYIHGVKDGDIFYFEHVEANGHDYARELGLKREKITGQMGDNVYEAPYKLAMELGVPFRSTMKTEFPWQSVMLETNTSAAEQKWNEMMKDLGNEPTPGSERPAQVIWANPFGGENKSKGFDLKGSAKDRKKFVDIIKTYIAGGAKVIIMPNDTQWGTKEIAEEFLKNASLTDVERQSVMVGPSPKEDARAIKYFVAKSDRVMTVEGGMMHLAFLLDKMIDFVFMPGAGREHWWAYHKNKFNMLDSAMLSKMQMVKDGASAPGGIDLNGMNLELAIERDGKGISMPVPAHEVIKWQDIQGFTPRIIDVKPLNVLPVLSEINQTPAKTFIARASQ